jgi:tetratricopeptide (TPR) repeat protein
MLSSFQTWKERRRTIRELRALQKEEMQELRVSDTNPLLQVKMSLDCNDAETALRYWKYAWYRYPGYVKQAPETLGILLGLKLFDDAEAIMLEGKKRSPNEARYAEGYALVAEHRGSLEESLERWKHVRKRFPGSWVAYVNPARSLRGIRRFGEAESLLAKATSRFPNTLQAWLEFASVAEDRMNWEMARLRWQQVSSRFQHVLGALGQCRGMIALGQFDEAESFLMDVRAMFEYDARVAMSWAQVAELRGDVDTAIDRWAAIRRRFPATIRSYQEGARLLRTTRRFPELDILLAEAAQRFCAEELALIKNEETM